MLSITLANLWLFVSLKPSACVQALAFLACEGLKHHFQRGVVASVTVTLLCQQALNVSKTFCACACASCFIPIKTE